MKNVKILLPNINSVREFVNIACKYSGDMVIKSNEYIINAKSIIGILSLDLSEPINLSIEDENCDDFIKNIRKYLV